MKKKLDVRDMDRLVRQQKDVIKEEVDYPGVIGTKIQWLLRQEDGMPNFQMRRFTMEKGGIIPLHSHDWEHEVFFLSGQGALLSEIGEIPVKADDAAYVDGSKNHGFRNTGDEDFVFLCMIPVTE